MTRQIAYSKVILPSGIVLHREVIVFDECGNVLRHFPLTEELPFVEWRDETYIIK
ncbi:MAG: hypothetical protein PUI06_06295 [Prevotella sp.]|nr:hypothetical protein [Prevotella sp.]MDY5667108.1 hypothetical protein [Alloprevotella sp.]